jgi:hypothetical protein
MVVEVSTIGAVESKGRTNHVEENPGVEDIAPRRCTDPNPSAEPLGIGPWIAELRHCAMHTDRLHVDQGAAVAG